MLDSKLVGSVIKNYREKKQLSQEVVSGLADIGRTHLSAIERGERKPTLETFYKISQAMRVRPSFLMQQIEDLIEEDFFRIKRTRNRFRFPALHICPSLKYSDSA